MSLHNACFLVEQKVVLACRRKTNKSWRSVSQNCAKMARVILGRDLPGAPFVVLPGCWHDLRQTYRVSSSIQPALLPIEALPSPNMASAAGPKVQPKSSLIQPFPRAFKV